MSSEFLSFVICRLEIIVGANKYHLHITGSSHIERNIHAKYTEFAPHVAGLKSVATTNMCNMCINRLAVEAD